MTEAPGQARAVSATDDEARAPGASDPGAAARSADVTTQRAPAPATPAARVAPPAPASPARPSAGTVPPDAAEDGARDWREQWRAARSALSYDPAAPGSAGATVPATPGTSLAAPAPLGPHQSADDDGEAARGGFRAALAAGLAQAKAVAAGSWTVPKADTGTSTSSPIPGLRTEDGARPATRRTPSAPPGGAQSPAAASPASRSAVPVVTTVGIPAAAAGTAGIGTAGTGTAGTGTAGIGTAAAAALTAATALAPGTSSQPTVQAARHGRTEGPAQPGARPVAAQPARPPARGPSRVRRAHLKLTRIDPWTIMKVSFMLSIAFGIMTLVAVAVVWSMLDAAGVFTSLNDTVESVTGEGGGALGFDLMSWVGFDRVMGFTTLIAVVDVVLITALSTLAAFLYNLAASLLGGVEVTFVEDHP